jgi:hypothetical protein
MFGKASVLMVMGFSLIFLTIGHNFNNTTVRAVDNVVSYYDETKAHNIAVSGANLALNEIFQDQEWDDGYSDIEMMGGVVDVEVLHFGYDVNVVSTGTFDGVEKTVRIQLSPSGYNKFAWYVGNMSSKVFVNGDTIFGPFHTQSELNIGGDPVFMGKVTTLKGIAPDIKKLVQNGFEPEFHGGYETGVDIPLETNYQFDKQRDLAIDGVNNKGGSSYFENTDLWMKFNSDGTVTYRTGTGPDTAAYGPPVTEDITTFAPNGVAYLKKGDIYVSGQVKGQLSIVSGESSGIGNGNVYLVDDLTYTEPPMVWDNAQGKYVPDYDAQDMLGVLATNNVIIKNNDENVAHKDIHVDASIFCAQGGFQMEDKTIGDAGSLYLRGGMIAAKEEILGITDKDGNVTNGYRKHVIFDERFMLKMPPAFPLTGNLEILSWYE